MRGITFEIPNEYGKYLFELLSEINLSELAWRIGGGESYVIENETLGEPLFSSTGVVNGDILYENISKDDYYLIFVDLKAFPNQSDAKEIATYSAFVKSDCQFVLLIVDSTYVSIYSKDQNIVKQLFSNGIRFGYKNIKYITEENDYRTNLIAF